jgi:hypothetical protein
VSDDWRSRPRGTKRRSTISILQAAKSAGCHSVTFPDGTIVTIAPDQAPATDVQAAGNPWDADLAAE